MYQAEDGELYIMEPEEEACPEAGLGWGLEVPLEDGDVITCPCCGEKTVALRMSGIRGIITKRILVGAVQRIDGYTCLVYYMMVNEIDKYGSTDITVYPEDAYVLDKRGAIHMASHVKRKGFGIRERAKWEWKSRVVNGMEMIYRDHGSVNGRKKGAVVWTECEISSGDTGEKTAVDLFLKNGGGDPLAWFRFWKRHPNAENLLRTGWTEVAISAMKRQTDESLIDWEASRPNGMLRMSRADWRRETAACPWTAQMLRSWAQWLGAGLKPETERFLEAYQFFGFVTLDKILEKRGYDDRIGPERVMAYLKKQGMERGDEAQYLLDLWRCRKELAGERELTWEELWPRELRRAHDEAAEMLAALNEREAREEYRDGFRRVLERLKQVEWTDGELCVRLPRDNGELVREGQVLRHCVGTYGKTHAKGESVILFIRHYRRPERSYYTLNIRFTETGWYEIQLHGYGNERHGPYKEHSHRIPKKVRDFVDRWEKEILTPFRRKELEKKKKQERKSA